MNIEEIQAMIMDKGYGVFHEKLRFVAEEDQKNSILPDVKNHILSLLNLYSVTPTYRTVLPSGAFEKCEEGFDIHISLTVGSETYSEKELQSLVKAVKNLGDKPFFADFWYEGKAGGCYLKEDEDETIFFENSAWTGGALLPSLLHKTGSYFDYGIEADYWDSGSLMAAKLSNGNLVNPLCLRDNTLLNEKHEWVAYQYYVDVLFDYDAYPEKLDELKGVIVDNLEEEDVEMISDWWEEEKHWPLIMGPIWCMDKLSEAQEFFNKLNAVIETIPGDVEVKVDGIWADVYDMTAANLMWTKDEGIHLVPIRL